MVAVRFVTSLLFVVSAGVLSSCDFYRDSSVERKGIATENEELVTKLEAGLADAGIPYESSRNPNGLWSVTWEVVNDPAARSILQSVEGRSPEDTSTLCFSQSVRFDEFTNRLRNNAIPFESAEPSLSEWCARWKSEFDEKVAEIDSSWRNIRELENRVENSE